MKKAGSVILFFGVLFILAGTQQGFAALKVTKPPPVVKPSPPDLSVTVAFAQVVSLSKQSGITCYSPRPTFTIMNKGLSAATGFDYVIDWKLNPAHIWQMFTSRQNLSLRADGSMVINGNDAGWEQGWCVNETDWKPGWRITVDTVNAVEESNEGNNSAEKILDPMTLPMQTPPKTIRRDLQKIPVRK